jgi:hypothetical protein
MRLGVDASDTKAYGDQMQTVHFGFPKRAVFVVKAGSALCMIFVKGDLPNLLLPVPSFDPALLVLGVEAWARHVTRPWKSSYNTSQCLVSDNSLRKRALLCGLRSTRIDARLRAARSVRNSTCGWCASSSAARSSA